LTHKRDVFTKTSKNVFSKTAFFGWLGGAKVTQVVIKRLHTYEYISTTTHRMDLIQSALERGVSGVSQECLSDVPGQFLALLGCFGVRRSIKTIEISTPIGILSEDGFDKIDENDVFLP
jgi:hypothetical protein